VSTACGHCASVSLPDTRGQQHRGSDRNPIDTGATRHCFLWGPPENLFRIVGYVIQNWACRPVTLHDRILRYTVFLLLSFSRLFPLRMKCETFNPVDSLDGVSARRSTAPHWVNSLLFIAVVLLCFLWGF
jgi:hypothetical protein